MKINEVIKAAELEETATAGGTSAGAVAGGFAIGIGSTERAVDPTKKKKKSKLIRR